MQLPFKLVLAELLMLLLLDKEIVELLLILEHLLLQLEEVVEVMILDQPQL
jgi:hypothetical protein